MSKQKPVKTKKNIEKGKPAVNHPQTASRDGLWTNKSLLSIIVFLFFIVFILYPPFPRGLFFESELLPSLSLLSLLFGIAVIDQWRQRKPILFNSYLDIAILIYLLCYFLSLLVAVDLRTAILGAMRIFMYYGAYWMAVHLIDNKKQYRLLLNVLLAGAAGVAWVGIAAAAGIVHFNGAFTDNRFYSTFQYPNATAAYLGALLLIAAVFAVKAKNGWERSLYFSITSLLSMGLIGTLSKGGLIVAMLGLLALTALASREDRWRVLLSTIAALAIGGFACKIFLGQIAAKQGPTSIITVLLLVIIGFGSGYVWDLLEKKYAKMQLQSLPLLKWLFLGLAAIAAAVGLIFWRSIIPATFIERLAGLSNLNNQSYVTRIDFVRWAWAIIKDHPLLGTGAGGWNALYHQYQTYLYWTTETHSHLLQVGVEVGAIGLLAYLAIWAIHAWSLKDIRSMENYDLTVLAAGVAALVLFVHSSFDFDFSIPGLQVIAWVLVGSVGSRIGIKTNMQSFSKGSVRYIVIGLALIMAVGVFYTSITMKTGYTAYVAANELMEAQKAGEALEKYKEAASADPWSVKYKISLAQVYSQMLRSTGEKEYRILADMEAAKVEKINPYDVKLKEGLISIYNSTQNLDGCIRVAKSGIESAPLEIETYELYSGVLLESAKMYAYNDDLQQANRYAGEMLLIKDLVERNSAKIDPSRQWLWQGRKMEYSPVLQFNTAVAQFILGNYRNSEDILSPLSNLDEPYASEVIVLKAAINYVQGGQNYEAMLDKASATNDQAWNYFMVYQRIAQMREAAQ